MKSRAFTITTTSSQIVAAEPLTRSAWIHIGGNGIVYLGGSDVTVANGLPTEKHAVPLEITILAGETLHAIVTTGTESLRVLVEGD